MRFWTTAFEPCLRESGATLLAQGKNTCAPGFEPIPPRHVGISPLFFSTLESTKLSCRRWAYA